MPGVPFHDYDYRRICGFVHTRLGVHPRSLLAHHFDGCIAELLPGHPLLGNLGWFAVKSHP